MKWLNQLERKYGHLAIKGLMTYIVAGTAIAFCLQYLDPTGMIRYNISLVPSLVLQGEIWRFITFIFTPPQTRIFWIIFVLYFYYMIGNGLEQAWGSFKFNLYYLVGILGTIIATFLTNSTGTSVYLNLTLFLAFATIYPNFQILIFFILPVKMKYLGWLNWAFIGFTIVFGGTSARVLAIVSLLNYFLFFGKEIIGNIQTKRKVYGNRKQFQSGFANKDTFHRCTVCGVTEKDNPNMEFRYCSTCEGSYEYCMDHIKNHEHIRKTQNEE